MLSCSMLLMSCVWSQSSQTREQTIKKFLLETQIGEKKIPEIMDEFFLLPEVDSLKQKKTEALEVVISFLHKNLQNVNIEKPKIISYKHLEADKKNVLTQTPQDVYFVKFEDGFFLPVLFKQNCIVSLSLLNKGNKRFFF